MKPCLLLFFISGLIFTPSVLFSQSGRLTIAKEPSWATVNAINYANTTLDKDAADGYIDFDIETQVSLADQSKYYRYCKKILSQSGVQNGSEVSVAYDPSYEQLIFHTIRIIRDGETLNKLQLSKIKTVHQETELKNFIYNGSMNAVLILDDVRKGDIIEYSYTIKGFNPIFKNKYAGSFDMQFSVPMYNFYYKIIVPTGRKINIKSTNEILQPTINTANGQQVYEWYKSNCPPLHQQDYVPAWYNPYGEIQVSEFNSWKEVNDWAMELFPINQPLSPAVLKKISEIEAANSTDSAKLKAALQFVQNDIRYMGIEIGENSHKPADPSKVFNQRFGDCKEKSYLLCCMLHTMKMEAWPVLINTSLKKTLNDLLPAATDFNHCTVRVKLDNQYYWFDPTIDYQRGSIRDFFYPDYQAGLVIADNTTALTTIDFKNKSAVSIKEHFKVIDLSGSGTLIVTSTYKGGYADDIRSDFNDQSNAELMNSYQKFYGYYYPDIKADSITYIDNDSTGVFTSTEYYTIPQFWKTIKKDVKKFSFSAFNIDAALRRPKEKNRKMPFSLIYPENYQENIQVELPDPWHVTESETHLKNAAFAFDSKFYCTDNNVYLDVSYQSNKNFVSVDEAPVYFKDLETYDEGNNFELTAGDAGEDKKGTSDSSSPFIGLLIGLTIGGIIWWRKRK